MKKRTIYHRTRGIWYHSQLMSERCKRPELQKYVYGIEHSAGHLVMHGRTSGSGIDLDLKLPCEKYPSPFAKYFEGLENEPQKRMHFLIEKAIGAKDMSCIATELPLQTSRFEGFVDIVRESEDVIEILDYKPGARYENAIVQVAYYAELLSNLTGLPVNIFKVGWFDEYDAFQTTLDYGTHVKFVELGVNRMELWTNEQSSGVHTEL